MKVTKLHNGGELRDYGDHQEWWLNGKLHREDGPAIVDGDFQEWYLNGKLHREDGPAVVNGDDQEWYINGKLLTKAEFNSRITKGA